MKNIKRVVNTAFWHDEKVVKSFTPSDKYFYLYLLTNPYTSQLGIYQLLPEIGAYELGYSPEAFMVYLKRFEEEYDLIKFSYETNEVAVKNYLRHAIVKGGKPVLDCLLQEEKQVKDKTLLVYIYNNLIDKDIDNITVIKYLEHINNIYISNNENERIVFLRNLAISCEKKPKIAKPDDLNRKNCQAEADAMFDSLWKLYPRKLGKGSVKPATKRRLYGIGFDRMKKAIERYKADVDGRDIQYIMYGSRFFNSGYVDYLDDENDHVEAHGGEVQVGIDGSILE